MDPEPRQLQSAITPGNGRGKLAAAEIGAPALPDIPEWLRDLYPFRTTTVTVDGCRISMVNEGPSDAPPVVLLHGNPAWSFLFRRIIPQLSPRYHVVAPDLVGFGLSDKPADAAYHTLDRHIANFTATIQALGLKKITLVLHGWGGPIGLGYAVAHPENIARMVLSNTWAFPLPQRRGVKLPWSFRLAHSRLGAWLESALHLAVTSRLSYGTRQPLPDLVVEGYKYPFAHGSRCAIHGLWHRFTHPSAADGERLAAIAAGLKTIKAPVSLLWGAHDPMLPKLAAYLLRDELKNCSEPVFLAETSHFVPEDAPDALASAILSDKKPSTHVRPQPVFNILG